MTNVTVKNLGAGEINLYYKDALVLHVEGLSIEVIQSKNNIYFEAFIKMVKARIEFDELSDDRRVYYISKTAAGKIYPMLKGFVNGICDDNPAFINMLLNNQKL